MIVVNHSMSNNQLTVSDMAQIKRILDIVCARGAIQASEMETVGTVYNKLCNLLESVDEKTGGVKSSTPGDGNGE